MDTVNQMLTARFGPLGPMLALLFLAVVLVAASLPTLLQARGSAGQAEGAAQIHECHPAKRNAAPGRRGAEA